MTWPALILKFFIWMALLKISNDLSRVAESLATIARECYARTP